MSDPTQLPLEEQIAQMIVVRASGYLFDRQIRFPQWEPDRQTLRYWLETLNVGGVILLGGSAVEIAQRSAQLQSWAKTPLLIAADIEEGVGQRFAGATWFPPPMALGEIAKTNLSLARQYARNMGAVTAQEALAMGINWLLAPVADVNNNPDNPVINVRAFAETPEIVSELSGAFMEGAKEYGVLTTAKHFPGHGDTATDSHLALPILKVDSDRLQEIELPPFQSAIAQGVDGVMSAHLLVPSWDAKLPATLSSKILTEQLRHTLGFDGLIVTDALIMGALSQIASPEELPVLAIEAGADIVLMPENPEGAIASIMVAIKNGRLSQERIAASVERIGKAKAKVTTASPPNLLTALATVHAQQSKADILTASLQMSGNLLLPLPKPDQPLKNLIIVDDLLNCGELDRNHSAIAIPQQLGYELQLLGQAQVFPNPPSPSPLTLVQLFTRGNPFRGESGLSETVKRFLQSLFQQDCVQAVIVYGSPYVLNWLKPNLPETVPWIFSYGQMGEASAIALGQLFELSQLPSSQDKSFL
ncbi:MAG: beta-glucosidase [Cyanobacteria bacterium SW_9_44_58]|nr:MAG: beta-glucosidase [Cyanobacteria bacterium SW_9_44_58]